MATTVCVALVGLAYLLLEAAWLVGQPVPAGIDEATHYNKAVANGQLQFIGARAPSPYRPGIPAVEYLSDQSTRAFTLPGRLVAQGIYTCTGNRPDVSAACTEEGAPCSRYASCPQAAIGSSGTAVVASYDGDYEPTLYVIPGALAHLANDDIGGMRLARLGTILLAVVALTTAAGLLATRNGTPWALLGLLAATSPMVVHLNAVVNPSGGETVLTICFAAAVIRVVRDRDKAPLFAWAAFAVAGGLLAVSRVSGTGWVLVLLTTGAALLGIRGTREVVSRCRRRAVPALAVVALGLVADQLWWQVAMGRPHGVAPLSDARFYILGSFDEVPRLFKEQIGVFGWSDTTMGDLFYIIWGAMVLTIIALALLVATRRQRVVLVTLCAVDVLGTVILDAALRVTFGFPTSAMEGRYVLPLSVIAVLVAGETLRANRDRLSALLPQRLPLWVAGAVGVCQLAGFWADSRRFAVGVQGPLMFLGDSQWSPPIGWAPWIAAALVGCAVLVAAVLLSYRSTRTIRLTGPNVQSPVLSPAG